MRQVAVGIVGVVASALLLLALSVLRSPADDAYKAADGVALHPNVVETRSVTPSQATVEPSSTVMPATGAAPPPPGSVAPGVEIPSTRPPPRRHRAVGQRGANDTDRGQGLASAPRYDAVLLPNTTHHHVSFEGVMGVVRALAPSTSTVVVPPLPAEPASDAPRFAVCLYGLWGLGGAQAEHWRTTLPHLESSGMAFDVFVGTWDRARPTNATAGDSVLLSQYHAGNHSAGTPPDWFGSTVRFDDPAAAMEVVYGPRLKGYFVGNHSELRCSVPYCVVMAAQTNCMQAVAAHVAATGQKYRFAVVTRLKSPIRLPLRVFDCASSTLTWGQGEVLEVPPRRGNQSGGDAVCLSFGRCASFWRKHVWPYAATLGNDTVVTHVSFTKLKPHPLHKNGPGYAMWVSDFLAVAPLPALARLYAAAWSLLQHELPVLLAAAPDAKTDDETPDRKAATRAALALMNESSLPLLPATKNMLATEWLHARAIERAGLQPFPVDAGLSGVMQPIDPATGMAYNATTYTPEYHARVGRDSIAQSDACTPGGAARYLQDSCTDVLRQMMRKPRAVQWRQADTTCCTEFRTCQGYQTRYYKRRGIPEPIADEEMAALKARLARGKSLPKRFTFDGRGHIVRRMN